MGGGGVIREEKKEKEKGEKEEKEKEEKEEKKKENCHGRAGGHQTLYPKK